MIVIQTTLDRRAMTALARAVRKTLRRGRNGPVRMLAWFVVLVESFLTAVYLRGGQEGWQINVLLGLIMLVCILGEDWANGLVALRRIPPDCREVNATFQEDSAFVCRSQAGEEWRLYQQMKVAVEMADWFILLLEGGQGRVFSKKGFTWGTPEEFRARIPEKTGLKILKMR